MKKLQNEGISLIEVIITVALLLLAGGALVQLGISSLSASDSSRMRSLSLQKANEALEFSRAARDSDPNGFFNLSGNYSLDESGSLSDAATIFHTSTCNPANFSANTTCKETVTVGGSPVDIWRVISIVGSGTSKKEITAYVFWQGRGKTFSNVTTSTVLTKWR